MRTTLQKMKARNWQKSDMIYERLNQHPADHAATFLVMILSALYIKTKSNLSTDRLLLNLVFHFILYKLPRHITPRAPQNYGDLTLLPLLSTSIQTEASDDNFLLTLIQNIGQINDTMPYSFPIVLISITNRYRTSEASTRSQASSIRSAEITSISDAI